MDTQRAMVYSRVSTIEQSHGYSLQTQAESCRRYCADHAYAVLAEFSDAHSGTELDRPGLNALLDAAKDLRPDIIVLHDVDRLGREVIVQAIAERDLTRHGARIEYVLGGNTDTPDGELLKMVKQGIAVYENRQRVERSRRGKDGRVRDGHPLVAARPAYGYRYIGGDRTGRLDPDPSEAPIVQRIFRWCVEDGLTTYEIAKRLHAQQVPTRADSNPIVHKRAGRHFWDPHTVARILRNETYKGVWHWNKTRRVKVHRDGRERVVQKPRPRDEWLTLPVEPLVDEATWERAQERLVRNKQMASRNTKRTYLLRGLVFCPCGRRWTGRYKNHLDRAYYRCPTTEGEPWREDCPARFGIEQTRLETGVLNAVKAFLLDPETRRAALGAERDRIGAEQARLAEDVATIDTSLTRIERQLGKLLDNALADAFPAEQIQERTRALNEERARLLTDRARQLAALETPVVDAEEAIAELAPMVETAFAAAEPDELRRLLELLRIEVHVIDREHVRLTGILGAVEVPLRSSLR